MNGYNVKVVYASKELSAKDKIRIKDFTNAISLDEATQEQGKLILAVDYFAKCEVHNEKAEDKDYMKYVIVTKDGTKYVTGSNSFITAFEDIADEMADAGEGDYEIEVYRMESKNYKGKQFITCSIV